jgi:hypothetical protein
MITVPSPYRPIIEPNSTPTRQTRQFFNAVAALAPLTGTGSPEGVVKANATRLYMDTTGTAGSILYVKRDDDVGGDRALGWIAV